MPDENQIETECHACMRPTAHAIVRAFRDNWTWEDDEYPHNSVSGTDDYLIVRCGGCKQFAFVSRSWCSEDSSHGEPTIAHFPPVPARAKPAWVNRQNRASTEALNLIEEIYRALAAGVDRLTAMGVRALLENIMVETVGDQGSFKANVAAFVNEGYVGTRYESLVLKVLDVGHATIHRGYNVSRDELLVMLGLLESVLEQVYVHPVAVEALADPPARSKRSRPAKT